jgi:periplasmic protein TonB
MELLMRMRSTADGASVARSVAPAVRPRTLSLGLCVSIGVHAALIVAAVAAPARSLLEDAPVTVEIVDQVLPPPVVAPAEPPPPKLDVARPVVVKRVRPVDVPIPPPTEAPPPQEQVADPAPPVASAPTTETTQDPRAVLVATAPPGSGISGGGPTGVVDGRGQGGVASESQRRNLADRYRDDLLRTRIRDHFRYPAEARDLELTGRVVVQVTVDRNGRLLAARIAGSCPHQLLCDDGLRTVRASAPFPALPADLGDSLRIEIPLKYDFQ